MKPPKFEHGIPVIDERPLRIAAGILFSLSVLSIFRIGATGDFSWLLIFVTFITADLLIRIFLNPNLSPTVAIGNLFTRGGTPRWVGLAQKQFAWILGVLLAAILLISFELIGQRNPIASLACIGCLTLLMYEAFFGVCVGCTLYGKVFPNKPTICADGSCEYNLKNS
jgi:hypothetical protein